MVEKPPQNSDRRASGLFSGSKHIKELLADEFRLLVSISESRRETVRKDIIDGSTPETRYYVLLSISVLIASIGLVTNSPAVVIGAMLISPLMTPIFGISLGLIRGDIALVRKALIVEFGGVALAILVAALLGLLPFVSQVTPEMLARTEPTLLDLAVAALAGFAGCLATIDERISPVLPGIAMATALTPPLATCGLCIALGAYYGAWGAFLLFFANFLAILIVSAILFIIGGFVSKTEAAFRYGLIRRFVPAGIGLIILTIILTNTLLGVIDDLRTKRKIQFVLETALATEPATTIDRVIFKKSAGRLTSLPRSQQRGCYLPPKSKQSKKGSANAWKKSPRSSYVAIS